MNVELLTGHNVIASKSNLWILDLLHQLIAPIREPLVIILSVFGQDEGHGVLDHAVSLRVERDEQGLQQLPRAVRQLEPDEATESTHQIGAGDLVGLANIIIIH